ncbi:Putative C2H2 finger domain transcription factor CON7 [Septoria linicola]|uniref:C2H2 finger domain transcription factor CON7 n=1 Tax=Septoria linicola TaxID=215465 RepID=A0A9Q9B7S4_9PEZI|nr:Putative C2H2 finger domain transcription factor CON7 [Septoria linicola]
MAEIFGTAASVLQVAEAGASLATTLYNYAKSVKSAEKDIKKIAREVRLTSAVLQQAHDQLQGQSNVQTCTTKAIHDLDELLIGCREAFQEVDNALTKSMKPGIGGAFSVSMTEKFKWPLRSTKLGVLRAHLEKLKTTLLLMLTVLAYGNKTKLQIQSLMQAKEDAAQKHEELSQAFSKLEKEVNANSTAAISTMTTAEAGTITTNAMVNQPTPVAGHRSSVRTIRTDEHPTSIDLEYCALAVNKLSASIEAATKHWHTHHVLEYRNIRSSLRETRQTCRQLRTRASAMPPTSTTAIPAVQSEPEAIGSNSPDTLLGSAEFAAAVADLAFDEQYSLAKDKDHLSRPQAPCAPLAYAPSGFLAPEVTSYDILPWLSDRKIPHRTEAEYEHGNWIVDTPQSDSESWRQQREQQNTQMAPAFLPIEYLETTYPGSRGSAPQSSAGDTEKLAQEAYRGESPTFTDVPHSEFSSEKKFALHRFRDREREPRVERISSDGLPQKRQDHSDSHESKAYYHWSEGVDIINKGRDQDSNRLSHSTSEEREIPCRELDSNGSHTGLPRPPISKAWHYEQSVGRSIRSDQSGEPDLRGDAEKAGDVEAESGDEDTLVDDLLRKWTTVVP